jgi:hypothetical protein
MSVDQRDHSPNLWTALGAYAFFIVLTAGLGVGLVFIAVSVGANLWLLGLLSVPLGLVTARVLFSVHLRRPIGRHGVSAVLFGIVLATVGGALGDLIGLTLLGFLFGYLLFVDWLGAVRMSQRFRSRAY